MKIILYLIAGIVSCLIGWFVSQLFIIDLIKLAQEETLPFRPDFILLPILAPCLTVSMIVATIFLSNPIHGRANKRILPSYVKTAAGIGGLAGLMAAAITWILYQTTVSDGVVRVVAWSIMGTATGLAEGLSWYWLDKEAVGSSKKETQNRIGKATLFGLLAGILAAVLVEFIRRIFELGGGEDPVGFIILGISLGLCINFAANPTYQIALRAGEGFETIDPKRQSKESSQKPKPRINHRDLKFAPAKFERRTTIEEGLSIRLPKTLKEPIIIGSREDAHIYLPGIPKETAELIIDRDGVRICPQFDNIVQIQGTKLSDGTEEPLRHNQILTFYHQIDEDSTEDEKYYRFVFYDRFLEPRA
ncbi:MAG: hypothetical protein AB4063_24775 [Crocosphaera sp.]